MAGLILMLLFGVALIAAPFVAPLVQFDPGAVGTIIMLCFGGLFVVVSTTLIVFTKLYRKTTASQVFVRTGSSGGMKVFKDGGGIVVPIIHNVSWVILEQLRLEIQRNGPKALLTADKFRADVTAQFFVRVPSDDAAIKDAARTFGSRMDIKRVTEHADTLLDSALRAVAAKKSLEALNSDRDAFIIEVQKAVEGDLRKMGLQLDTVTISNLDMTPTSSLNEANVFDAQGMRSAAEITQRQLTGRNEIVRAGEVERLQQDVEARRKQLELEQQRAEAEASQEAKIAAAQAASRQETEQQRIKADREITLADVARQKATEVALREQQQAIEVADQQKQEGVARAEAKRAAAQAELARAEAAREKEQQGVQTVAAVETASREKQRQVIKAEGDAEMDLIAQQRAADAKAYAVQKEAEAGRLAADASAEAVRKQAEAKRDAKIAEADGEKALQLVPVEVKSREVAVEQRRVEEVLKPELVARERSGQVAQDFELAKLRITRSADVQIALGTAVASLAGKIEAKVFGTPEDVQRLLHGVLQGVGISQAVEGLLESAGPKTREVIDTVVGMAQSALESSTAPDADTAATPPTPPAPNEHSANPEQCQAPATAKPHKP